MKKRLSAILLASLMLISVLSACNEAVPPEPPDSTAPVDYPPPPSTPEEIPGPEPDDFRGKAGIGWNPLDYGGAFKAFDAPVKIQIGTFDRGLDDAPPINDNYYTRWVNENFGANLNVTVEYVPIDISDTMASYNRLIAVHAQPTILMEYDWPKVTQWWRESALLIIEPDQFLEIAPTWFKNAGGADKLEAFSIGPNYYFLPALRPYWDTNYTWVTFFRDDWYRDNDLGLPATWEEWVEAQLIFKKKYNLPYTLDLCGFTNNFQFRLESPFPRDEREWVMYSDVNVPSLPAPGAYNRLKMLNHLYSLGLINPEFDLDEGGAAGEQTKVLQDFINGNLYRYSFFVQPSMPDLEAFYENNPDASLGIMYNNTVYEWERDAWGYITERQDHAADPAGVFLCFSERATADEIRAAYMYLEWMVQPDVLDHFQWGAEGITYTVDASGGRIMKPVEEQGDMRMGFSNNKDYWAVVVEARTAGTAEETVAAVMPRNLPQSDKLVQEAIDRYAYMRVRADAGLTYGDPFFSTHIASLDKYAGALTSLFAELATALVKADPAAFDAMYDDAVAQYRVAGFMEIEWERLAAYETGLATHLPDIAAARMPFVPFDHTKVIDREYK